jgi:hypothetical protein
MVIRPLWPISDNLVSQFRHLTWSRPTLRRQPQRYAHHNEQPRRTAFAIARAILVPAGHVMRDPVDPHTTVPAVQRIAALGGPATTAPEARSTGDQVALRTLGQAAQDMTARAALPIEDPVALPMMDLAAPATTAQGGLATPVPAEREPDAPQFADRTALYVRHRSGLPALQGLCATSRAIRPSDLLQTPTLRACNPRRTDCTIYASSASSSALCSRKTRRSSRSSGAVPTPPSVARDHGLTGCARRPG